MSFDPKRLKNYPEKPGVYLMKDLHGEVLYVGKAKRLRNRLRQYFSKGGDGREMIPRLIKRVESIDTIVVSSEKEALLLENTLIKRHQPKYNVLFKDDKSYVHLEISRHEWPMIRLLRFKGKPKGKGHFFGPYTNAYAARQTLELLKRLFPLRQCSDRELKNRTRPCLLYGMGRCSAPCVGHVSHHEYAQHVERAIRFLKGERKQVIDDLCSAMQVASEKLEYEKAGRILESIRALEATVERQEVAKARGKDMDALALFRRWDKVMLVQLFFRSGKLVGAKQHLAQTQMDDAAVLEQFILQHYLENELRPQEILLPIELHSQDILSELLSSRNRRKLTLHVSKRGEKARFVEMARENAETALQKDMNEEVQKEQLLLELQDKLNLLNFPGRIECFDISNMGQKEPVAAMVVYVQGKPERSSYRKYNLKVADDYGGMREVLSRRLKKGNPPDLIIVDGGRGQLNSAIEVFKELNLVGIDCIGLAKERGRHDKGLSLERVFLSGKKDPVVLSRRSPLLFFLQSIRDEAHRVAITFQKSKRSKASLASRLDQIPGIGPKKKQALLKHFGSVKRLFEASVNEISSVKGIALRDARAVADAAKLFLSS